MKELFTVVLKAVWGPAFRRASAELCLVAFAAALAAVDAYFKGYVGIDPTALLVIRIALMWAERVYFQAKAKVAELPTE